MIYPSHPPEYEVEFVDENGKKLGIETVKMEQIEKISWERKETAET